MTNPTANIRPDPNRVVVTHQQTGELRLRYSPIDPQRLAKPTTGGEK